MSEHKHAVKNTTMHWQSMSNKPQHPMGQSKHSNKGRTLVKRKINKEGIAIRERKNSLNLNKGFQIDNDWFTF